MSNPWDDLPDIPVVTKKPWDILPDVESVPVEESPTFREGLEYLIPPLTDTIFPDVEKDDVPDQTIESIKPIDDNIFISKRRGELQQAERDFGKGSKEYTEAFDKYNQVTKNKSQGIDLALEQNVYTASLEMLRPFETLIDNLVPFGLYKTSEEQGLIGPASTRIERIANLAEGATGVIGSFAVPGGVTSQLLKVPRYAQALTAISVKYGPKLAQVVDSGIRNIITFNLQKQTYVPITTSAKERLSNVVDATKEAAMFSAMGVPEIMKPTVGKVITPALLFAYGSAGENIPWDERIANGVILMGIHLLGTESRNKARAQMEETLVQAGIKTEDARAMTKNALTQITPTVIDEVKAKVTEPPPLPVQEEVKPLRSVNELRAEEEAANLQPTGVPSTIDVAKGIAEEFPQPKPGNAPEVLDKLHRVFKAKEVIDLTPEERISIESIEPARLRYLAQFFDAKRIASMPESERLELENNHDTFNFLSRYFTPKEIGAMPTEERNLLANNSDHLRDVVTAKDLGPIQSQVETEARVEPPIAETVSRESQQPYEYSNVMFKIYWESKQERVRNRTQTILDKPVPPKKSRYTKTDAMQRKNAQTERDRVLDKSWATARREAIEQALKDGFTVPYDVLKDYSDLVKKYGAEVTQGEEGAQKPLETTVAKPKTEVPKESQGVPLQQGVTQTPAGGATPPLESGVSLSEKTNQALQGKIDAAAKRLAKRKKLTGSLNLGVTGEQAGIAAQNLADIAIISAAKIGQKAVDFTTWAQGVELEYGPAVNPHLKNIWNESIAIYNNEVKNTATQAKAVEFRDQYGLREPDATTKLFADNLAPVLATIDKSVLAKEFKSGGKMAPSQANESKAEILKKSIDAGIKHLDSIEYSPDDFLNVVDGMTKGKGKVEGFGSSAAEILKETWMAESPDDAIRNINLRRAQRGTSRITDLPKELAAGGEPLLKKTPFVPNDETKSLIQRAMPKSIRPETTARIIQGMPFDLPPDPTAQRNMLRSLISSAVELQKVQVSGRQERNTLGNIAIRALNKLQTSRYYVSDMAEKLADPKMYIMDQQVERIGTGLDSALPRFWEDTYKKNNIPDKLRYHLATDVAGENKLNSAIAEVLYLDPKGKENQTVLKEALAVIDSDKFAPEIHRLIDTYHEVNNNIAAQHVKVQQTIRFDEFWEKNGQRIVEGEAKSEVGDRKYQAKTTNLLTEEEKYLPKYINEEGKIVSVSRSEMLDRVRFLRNSDNIEQVLEEANGWKGGTREFYWMTEFKPGEIVEVESPDGAEMFDIDSIMYDKASKPEFSGEISERTMPEIDKATGKSRARKDKNVFSLEENHLRDLQLKTYTHALVKELAESLNKHMASGEISKQEARVYADRLALLRGRAELPSDLTMAERKLTGLAWKLHFAMATKAVWFAARQVLQGASFGQILSQYKPGDVQLAYAKMVIDLAKPESQARKDLTVYRKNQVEQASAFFHERMLSSDPGEYGYTSRLANYIGLLSGLSDSYGARIPVFEAGYNIADKYANKLARNTPEYTQGNFENDLWFDTLSFGDATMVRELLSKARSEDGTFTRQALEPAVREIAQMKNANVNFKYRASERTMLEGNVNARPIVGIFTFPRGNLDIQWRQIIKPLAKGMRQVSEKGHLEGSIEPVKQGLRAMLGSVAAYTLCGIVTAFWLKEKKAWGKDQDPRKTKSSGTMIDSLSYTPGSIGLSQAWDVGKAGAELGGTLAAESIMAFDHAFSDEPMDFTQSIMKSEKLFNATVSLAPIAGDIVTYMEAYHNKAGADNWDTVKWLWDKWKNGIEEQFPGEDADRTMHESIMHGLLNTSEYHDPRSPWQIMKDSFVWGELKRKVNPDIVTGEE